MPQVNLTTEMCQALLDVWTHMPIWIKERGRIVSINDIPMPNISWRNNCTNYNAENGICKFCCNHMIRLENGQRVMRPTEFVAMTRRVKDNEWWGSYSEEGHELIDISIVSQEETESVLAQDSKVRGLKSRMSEYRPVGSAWDVIRDRGNSPSCTTSTGKGKDKKWHTCPFHTGYSEVNARIALGGDVREVAKGIIWFFIRPDYRLKEPRNEWTWSDYLNYRAVISEDIQRMVNRKSNPIAPEKATKIAWGKFMGAHPELADYKAAVDNVALGGKLLDEARRDAYLYLKRNGFDVSKKEALDAYNWSVTTIPVRKEIFHFHSSTWKCPTTYDAPTGKYAARVIRHTAVTDKFKEIYAESVDEHDAVVKLATGEYMSAVAFNWHSLKDRKRLLGCTCKKCKQEDIWYPNYDKDGLKYFTFKAEALLHPANMEIMAGDLSRLQEQNKDKCPLSSTEEDWLDTSRRLLAYDLTELPDEQNLDADEVYIEELDPEDDENRVAAHENPYGLVITNLDLVETSDNVDIALKDIRKSGPVKTYFVDPKLLEYGGLDTLKTVDRILAEGKEVQARITKRDSLLPGDKWAINKPKLNSADERKIYREKLDAFLLSLKWRSFRPDRDE